MAVIVMTWTPSNPYTISYEVRYALDSPNPNYLYITTTNTTITIPGLMDNATYVVGVRAICDGGIYSQWSQKFLVTCDNINNCFMDGYALYTGAEIYGVYYNWYAASDSKMAMSGWHVPTNEEWNNLGLSLGGTLTITELPPMEKVENIAHYMKITTLWIPGDMCGGNNSSGLSILPGGLITDTEISSERTSTGNYWCSDQESTSFGKYKTFTYNSCHISRSLIQYKKNYGMNIRLVKDDPSGWIEGDIYVDYEGNGYSTKLMDDGNVWMTQDLKTYRYNDGTPLPLNPLDWSTRTTGARHSYV